jgi:Flp pilus assembly protein TadD
VGFVVAERVLYLPSMGFCMLVGFGAWQMLRNRRKLVSKSTKCLLISLLVFYAAKTQLQNRVWTSERDLYVSAVRSYPTNSKMWHNLGTQLEGGITLEQSVWLMRRCIEYDPQYIAAYSDLGVVLTRLNEKEEAEKTLNKAIELIEEQFASPTPHLSHRDILAYIRLSSLIKTNHTRLPEALRLCKTAIERLPDDFRVLRETGHVLLHMGKPTEAKVYLQKALELKPSEPNVNYLLGVTEGELGNLDVAERSIRRAMSLGPGSNVQVYATELANILRKMGRREEAEAALAQNSLSHDNWN